MIPLDSDQMTRILKPLAEQNAGAGAGESATHPTSDEKSPHNTTVPSIGNIPVFNNIPKDWFNDPQNFNLSEIGTPKEPDQAPNNVVGMPIRIDIPADLPQVLDQQQTQAQVEKTDANNINLTDKSKQPGEGAGNSCSPTENDDTVKQQTMEHGLAKPVVKGGSKEAVGVGEDEHEHDHEYDHELCEKPHTHQLHQHDYEDHYPDEEHVEFHDVYDIDGDYGGFDHDYDDGVFDNDDAEAEDFDHYGHHIYGHEEDGDEGEEDYTGH